jgi:hypothetical protein
LILGKTPFNKQCEKYDSGLTKDKKSFYSSLTKDMGSIDFRLTKDMGSIDSSLTKETGSIDTTGLTQVTVSIQSAPKTISIIKAQVDFMLLKSTGESQQLL